MNIQNDQNVIEILTKFNIEENQRKRANVLVVVLSLMLFAYLYLWIAINTEPIPWWPFNFIKVFKEYDFQWLNWFIAGAVGTHVYLLWEVARNYVYFGIDATIRDSLNGSTQSKKAKADANQNSPDKNFIGQTPWYIVNAIRGPLITMVVMLLITNTSFDASIEAKSNDIPENENQSILSDESELNENEIDTLGEDVSEIDGLESASQEVEENRVLPSESTIVGNPSSIAASDGMNSETTSSQALGIALDLKKADVSLLAIIAFMLGFFNRLPLHILEGAARRIFPNAYADAYGKHAKKGKSKDAKNEKNEIVHEHKIKAVVEYSGSKDRTEEEPSENEPSENEPSKDDGISSAESENPADINK